MNEIMQPRAKKPTVYTSELETYLSNVQDKADKISDKFIVLFFILGLCLAPVYDTWTFTLLTSVFTVGLYAMARFALTNKFVARMIISLVYAIFMLQFIGQMHGMAEVHFFFFINIALLIIYQDWRIMIPYTVFAIGHHSVLAILQANAADFGLENANLANYFIGFDGRTMNGESVNYITTFQLFFHFGLAAMMAFICGWWSIIFRENSVYLMEKQFETQAQNEELSSSEEELRQNSDLLQTTNERLFLIQKEIEEKQILLNRAEKLVGLASYEIDLTSQELTHSDNLPLIYGENEIDTTQKIIEIAHPEDAHLVIETLTKAAQGEIANYDILYRSKGANLNEYKQYRAIGELIKDASGESKKLVGTVQDVTKEVELQQHIEEIFKKVQTSEEELRQNYEELQTTQEELNLQKERLEQIFDGVPAMIYQFKMTKEGKMSFPVVSKGSEMVYGLPPEVIMGDASSIALSIHQEDAEYFEKSIAESAQTMQNWNTDLRTVIDGRTIWIRGRAKPTKDKEGNIIWSGILQEITQQKQLEQEIQEKNENLQASEEELKQNLEELQTIQEELSIQKKRLEQIFDGVPAMIYQFKMTKEGKISFPVVSKGSEVTYGLPPNVIINDANSIISSIHEEDRLIFQQTLQESAQNLTDWNSDIRVIINGKIQWIRGNSKPIKDKEGTIIWSGIVQEVTAQKELEQKNNVQNEKLQATNDKLFVFQRQIEEKQELLNKAEKLAYSASYEVDTATNELNYSKNFANIYGESEIKNLDKLLELVHPEDTKKVTAMFEQATKGTISNYALAYRSKGSLFEEYKYYRTIGEVLEQTTSNSVRIIGTIQDITEETKQKHEVEEAYKQIQNSEKQLQQNLEELQTTQEQLQEQKTEVEKAFLELQATQSQLIQSEKMASLGQLVANIAHEINTPLGAIRSSATSIEQILEQTLPALPSFLKKLDDTTLTIFNEFVLLSSKKSDTLSSREKRVIKYELMEEFDKISLKNADEYADWIVDMNMYEEKSLFIPLIKNENAKEILQTAYQLSTIVRSNRTVKTATDRAAKIVFALKNFARQDQTGQKSMVNINDSIDITLTIYNNQIKHGIDVTRVLGNIPDFMGYPDELIQVWTNIIHNALQAMKNNGQLSIQTSVENNNVLVSIQDNGGGIPKEVQGRVFDAFFTTKSAGEGSGLGLDITRKIIQKHNGKIWFETEEGIGTTFFIQLPLN